MFVVHNDYWDILSRYFLDISSDLSQIQSLVGVILLMCALFTRYER